MSFSDETITWTALLIFGAPALIGVFSGSHAAFFIGLVGGFAAILGARLDPVVPIAILGVTCAISAAFAIASVRGAMQERRHRQMVDSRRSGLRGKPLERDA